jgi:hypothetical protein
MSARISRKTASPARTATGRRRAGGRRTARYIYWQDGDLWLGYLCEFPDYMTQGESRAELQANLKDIYDDIAAGHVPGVRRLAELRV